MKIKHWIDCHIRHEHIYDLGPDVDKWEENIKRKLEQEGSVEARCMYCGEILFTIVPQEVITDEQTD